MNGPDTQPTPPSLRAAIAHRFSLHDDKADDTEIDRAIRAGVELQGATLWILMLAILIASVGLNTNSTAVIIGAMLVSPLMGPIVGFGYGIGILDFALIRRALANLGIAATISLSTSTLYFLVTPLAEAQSELLARTTPSLWDVLIALAGGLAGIIGQTRREKSNVIPGIRSAVPAVRRRPRGQGRSGRRRRRGAGAFPQRDLPAHAACGRGQADQRVAEGAKRHV
ncbi:DUF389 domain-containing protein [Massilia sp. CT11-137]|uniref:DUF389 domain-containing protein n=1 Tax=Massilia sp. CT11-137 TaxID=3393901 RepID=UPI0039B01462